MKRDTCTNTGNMIEDARAELVTINNTLCLQVSSISCEENEDESKIAITPNDIATYLEPLLKLRNGTFSREIRKAVERCINTDYHRRTCEVAKAALTLQVTIRDFIAKCSGKGDNLTQSPSYTLTVNADTEQVLCWASTCTKQILDRVDEGNNNRI